MALGCMGGDGQVQTQTQLLVAMLDAGLDPQQAVSSPRWYLDRASEPEPGVLFESEVDPAVVEGMRERGHTPTLLGSEDIMGHAQVICCRADAGLMIPRAQSAATASS